MADAQKRASRRLSQSRRRLSALLDTAGLDAEIASVTTLGIGSAGLNARGNRDEDGTHARVMLEDGTGVIYREYASTNNMMSLYQAKETAIFEALRAAGLPSPQVLASTPGSGHSGGESAATLLSDDGGAPLEELFRSASKRQRAGFWSEVGATLRRLHDVDPEVAPILREPTFQRPWTDFVPYFLKSLKGVKDARPDLAPAVEQLRSMRDDLRAFVESRPKAICCAQAYLPGMMLEPDGTAWRCASWLNLGYYVSVRDPDQDVMLVVVAHREWTGDDVPESFFRAYGSRPDPIAELLYEASLQLSRGAKYLRGGSRPGWGPPPHSTAMAALDALPHTVDRLRSLLG